MTKEHTTHDFKFATRPQSIDFIVRVSQACAEGNVAEFTGTMDRPFLSLLMFKAKLLKIAQLYGTDLKGLFVRAIYITAQERFLGNDPAASLTKLRQ